MFRVAFGGHLPRASTVYQLGLRFQSGGSSAVVDSAGAKSKNAGRRFETLFKALSQTEKGRAAIKAYGECLDRQLDDVSKGCCKIEFQRLQKLFVELTKEGK